MMRLAFCTIPIRAPLKYGTWTAMEMGRCQEAGMEDLNLGVLMSSKQNNIGEGTQNTPSPIEIRKG